MVFRIKFNNVAKGGEEMRKGFLNGMLTGGLLSAILLMFAAPQFKKERKQLIGDSKQANSRARRVVKGVKNIAKDWMK